MRGVAIEYVTKLGAYGLTVAAAFAVALAVLLSVSSTAEAVEPGKSMTVEIAANPSDGTGVVRVEIDALSTASGSFGFNGEQSIVCNDNGKCDVGEDTDSSASTPNEKVDGDIFIVVDVDSDSADGFILLKVTNVLASDGPAVTYQSVEVETLPQPASLTAQPTSTTVAAADDDGDSDQTTIMATVKNDQDPAAEVVDETLTFITTLGLLDCDGDGGDAPSQVCQANTVDDPATADVTEGRATVTLIGGGREGPATITITHATLDPASVNVTFYGDAKNLSAEADQGSVEQGGTVAVVLTVTDSGGSPVKGVEPTGAAKDDVVGPAEKSNKVTTDFGTNREKDGKVVIPACDVHEPVTEAPVNDDDPALSLGSSGTNDDGQCIVMVMAPPEDPGTAGDQAATRGIHTLNFALAKLTASVEITVAGGPASIESDAPEYVDPLSDTTITVTVRDDEGVLVGETDINVIKVAGDGLAEGAATMDGAQTKNGTAKFSYAAGLEGQVVFRVIAGTDTGAIRDIITLTVGEAMPEEPDMPAMPDGDALSFLSPSIASFSGGSVADLAAAAEAECPGGATYWVQASDGSWPAAYSTTVTVAIANSPFEAAWADGFGMTAVFFSECEMDAMGDEG